MTKQAIVVSMRAQPFVPFILKMADGSAHTIRHPELIAVGTKLATIHNPVGESEVVLDLDLMTEIIPAPAESKKRSR